LRGAGNSSEQPAAQIFQGFTELVETTQCPYAPRARIRLIPQRYVAGSTEFVDAFRANQHWLAESGTDAVVIAIETEELGVDLIQQAETIRTLLEIVSGTRFSEDVLSPGWQLEIAGTRTFATLFSPIYPEDNPRSVIDEGFGYVMLQPEHSFHRLLPRGKLDPGRRAAIKDSIRRAFRNAGKDYDPLDTVPATEAQKYVKPLHMDDPIVSWWSLGSDLASSGQ
jgi:hypothetical protein